MVTLHANLLECGVSLWLVKVSLCSNSTSDHIYICCVDKRTAVLKDGDSSAHILISLCPTINMLFSIIITYMHSLRKLFDQNSCIFVIIGPYERQLRFTGFVHKSL